MLKTPDEIIREMLFGIYPNLADRTPAKALASLSGSEVHNLIYAMIEADRTQRAEAEWFDSEAVQDAITAARVAWEGESPMLETKQERYAAAGALMEMVIATAGLPLEVDSLSSRERVYKAILNGGGE